MRPGPGYLVTQHYLPEQIGSAFYTHDLALLFAELGAPLEVITGRPCYPRGHEFGDTPHREHRDGVRVRRLPTRPVRTDSVVRRILADGEFVARGVAAARIGGVRGGPVVAVSPGVSAAAVAQHVRGPDTRSAVVVHDVASGLARATGLTGGAVARATERIEARILSRFDVVVALSPQMADALRAIGVSAPIEVIPLWAADDLASHDAVTHAAPVVMYSGALGRKQGLSRLLDLAHGLQRAAPDAVVAIGGEGAGRAHVEAEVARRGLGNVRLQGLVAREHLAAHLASARVHVVPQDPATASFSVPSKVLSALAVGRPVVTTAVPGSPLHDLARACAGVTVVDPDDLDALVEAVRRRLDDPGLAATEGLAARAHIDAEHRRSVRGRELVGLVVGSLAVGSPDHEQEVAA